MTRDQTSRADAPMAFTRMPDLAARALAGSVVHANDELFAARENLITPGRPRFAEDDFGPKGKVYDGWETRRRREPGHDHAIVRLGVPGIVHGVVIDTSWFTGNYPPEASVEGTSLEPHPSVAELEEAEWVTLLERSAIAGNADNAFEVSDRRRFTHVRLSIYPDGGVARFRVHGRPVPDPRLLTGTIDLAALENGGEVIDCSDMFYSSPVQLIHPGRARTMGEGWENARRRDGGHDHVTVRLAARGRVRRVEIDTSHFVGNAPGWASLRGVEARAADIDDNPSWRDLVPRTRLQPDTRHVFRVSESSPVTHARLDVYPDGGLARLRVHGEVDDAALRHRVLTWLDALPGTHAVGVLTAHAGMSVGEAQDLLAHRPLTAPETVPDDVVMALLTP